MEHARHNWNGKLKNVKKCDRCKTPFKNGDVYITLAFYNERLSICEACNTKKINPV